MKAIIGTLLCCSLVFLYSCFHNKHIIYTNDISLPSLYYPLQNYIGTINLDDYKIPMNKDIQSEYCNIEIIVQNLIFENLEEQYSNFLLFIEFYYGSIYDWTPHNIKILLISNTNECEDNCHSFIISQYTTSCIAGTVDLKSGMIALGADGKAFGHELIHLFLYRTFPRQYPYGDVYHNDPIWHEWSIFNKCLVENSK